VKIRDISLSRIEPFGTRDTAAEFGTVPKNSGRLATLGYLKGRREDVREDKDGEVWKKAKESRVVPHPKLNPGCATVRNPAVWLPAAAILNKIYSLSLLLCSYINFLILCNYTG